MLLPTFNWPSLAILTLLWPVALLEVSNIPGPDPASIHTGILGGGSGVQILPLHHPLVSSQSKSHMFHVPQ